jgi:hypothetical protein
MKYFSALFANREMLQRLPSPVRLAWERVPDRAGEGSLIQTQALKPMAKGPHPASRLGEAEVSLRRSQVGHLLPPAAGEGWFAGRKIIR